MFAAAVALATLADPRPARWAADLASPVFAARTAAAEALERAGPAALPSLAVAATGPNPEAAHRAAELQERITRTLTAGRLLAPSRVTLPAGEQTATSILAAVAAQTGYALDFPDSEATLRPPAYPLPAWEAIRLACVAAGFDVAGVAPAGRPEPETAGERTWVREVATAEQSQERWLPFQVRFGDMSRRAAADAHNLRERQRHLAEAQYWDDQLQAQSRECAAAAVRRAVASLAEADPPPEGTGRITLRPATGSALAASGGVLLDARAAPVHLAAGVPGGYAAVLLRVRTEPRLVVERLDGVWLKSVTAGGKPVAGSRDGPVRVLPVNSGAVRLAPDGTATYQFDSPRRVIGVCGHAEAVLRVETAADTLDELSGVVRAVVRDDPTRLADSPIPGAMTRDGVRLSADPPTVTDGQVLVWVTAAYDPAAVRPGGGEKVRFEPDTVGGFGRGGFARINAMQATTTTGRTLPTARGLTARDAAGRVLEASVIRAERTAGTAGRVADRLQLKLASVPTRLTLGGCKLVPVEVPFTLTNVPTAAGTDTQ